MRSVGCPDPFLQVVFSYQQVRLVSAYLYRLFHRVFLYVDGIKVGGLWEAIDCISTIYKNSERWDLCESNGKL